MTRVTRDSFTWNADIIRKYQDVSIMFNTFLVTEHNPYIRGLQLIVDEVFGRWGFNPYTFNADEVLKRMTAVTPEVIASELENLNRDQLTLINHYINPLIRCMKSNYGNFIDIFDDTGYKTILEDVSQLYKYLEEFIYTE